jgi:CBS domain containing-hemolysin-like protein
LREPLFVPESRPVESLIVDMRAQRMEIAIVLDEYGGTAGLATLEDLVEEIVGEIQDEHESADQPFGRVGASDVLANGGTSVSQLAEALDLTLPSEEFESIGGFVFGRLGRLPQVGDTITEDGVIVRVLAMDRRRVAPVSLQLADTSPPVGANED